MSTDNGINLWPEDNSTVVVHRSHNRPPMAYTYDEKRQVWSDGQDNDIIIEQASKEPSEGSSVKVVDNLAYQTCSGCWEAFDSGHNRIVLHWDGTNAGPTR